MKILNKRLLVFAAACLISLNVNAAEITNITYDMGKIKVSGTAAKESDIKLVITDAASKINDVNGILAIKEFKSDADGLFTAEVSISESLKGSCSPKNIILSVKEKGGKKTVKNLIYAYESEINAVFTKIQTAKSIKEVISDEDNKRVLTAMGFSVEQLDKLSEEVQSEIIDIYDANTDLGNCSAEEMVEAFNSMLGLGFVNDGNPYGYTLLKAEFAGVEYSTITDVQRKAFIDTYMAKKRYKDYSSFYTAYDEANVLYEINNAISSNLCSIMEEYSDVLGIKNNAAYLKFKDFGNYKKGVVTDSIVTDLHSEPVSAKDEFIKILEAAVKAASKENTSGVSGGTGGSGGSGGSRNTIVKTDAPLREENKTVLFSDFSEKHWAYEAAISLSEKNIINGYEDGSFRPEKFVTRAEFIKMIVGAGNGAEKDAKCDFSDVSESDWFYSAVATAYREEIITGSDGLFRPFDTITRQEAAAIIYRKLSVMEIKPQTVRDAHMFDDENQIADYAKNAVDTLYKTGIISGVSSSEFRPLDGCTRAQAVMLIYGAFCK